MLVNLPLPHELKKKSNFDEHKPEISLLKKGNFIKQHNFPQMLPASWNRIEEGGKQRVAIAIVVVGMMKIQGRKSY